VNTSEPAATPNPTPLPTVEPTVSATVSPEAAVEIGDAYQTYWQVRAQALYNLDTSHLQEVMSGDHLAAAEELIAELRSEGRAIQTQVAHNYVVISASNENAKVADSYIDESVYVDAQTHAQLSAPTGQRLNELYVMANADGTWRVVDLVRSP
jgi:hypothetical protein